MRFGGKSGLGALFLVALAAVARAQAPAQATAPPVSRPDSLLAAAAAGNPQAQFDLGNYYFNARYVTLDYAQALAWYRKSAAQGFAPAQDQLG
ncbi:MAG TPA: SEL1-like repeat protein, partial [Candidatus Acidoferrales bacterium]|nr:SEL1-like repeat protein [Candidatus Acidoferrales bacterium]